MHAPLCIALTFLLQPLHPARHQQLARAHHHDVRACQAGQVTAAGSPPRARLMQPNFRQNSGSMGAAHALKEAQRRDLEGIKVPPAKPRPRAASRDTIAAGQRGQQGHVWSSQRHLWQGRDGTVGGVKRTPPFLFQLQELKSWRCSAAAASRSSCLPVPCAALARITDEGSSAACARFYRPLGSYSGFTLQRRVSKHGALAATAALT